MWGEGREGSRWDGPVQAAAAAKKARVVWSLHPLATPHESATGAYPGLRHGLYLVQSPLVDRLPTFHERAYSGRVGSLGVVQTEPSLYVISDGSMYRTLPWPPLLEKGSKRDQEVLV